MTTINWYAPSQLRKLADANRLVGFQLESALDSNASLPEFPSKTLTNFGNYEPEFVEKRRGQMENFYRLLPPFAYSQPCLRRFLGLDDPASAKNAREIAERVILLPQVLTFPYPQALPESITLTSKEEIFPAIMVDSVKECLESMQTLHVRCSLFFLPTLLTLVSERSGCSTFYVGPR